MRGLGREAAQSSAVGADLIERNVPWSGGGREWAYQDNASGADQVISHLTVGQRALLEAELTRRQNELDRQVADHQGGLSRAEHASEVLSQDSDDVSHREADREMDMTLTDREIAELGAVSAALRRLKEDRYGNCSDCGEAIAFDRLKVEPWALRCVPCESRRENAART
jgi:DnaK suppressor protein